MKRPVGFGAIGQRLESPPPSYDLELGRGIQWWALEAEMVTSVWRKPSALLTMGVPLAALCVVLGHVALYGVAHQADEGAAAHSWQLLMVAEAVLVVVFARRWLPRARTATLRVLAVVAGVMLANMAAVFFLT